MSILDDVISPSETRMSNDPLQLGGEDIPFRIIISEQGPIENKYLLNHYCEILGSREIEEKKRTFCVWKFYFTRQRRNYL